MLVIFVRARSITGIITENISYLFRKFADPTRMFSSEIQLRFSEIYVSMSDGNWKQQQHMEASECSSCWFQRAAYSPERNGAHHRGIVIAAVEKDVRVTHSRGPLGVTIYIPTYFQFGDDCKTWGRICCNHPG